MALEMQDRAARLTDPAPAAVRLRQPSAAAYGWIVFIQVAVVVLGTLAATWSTWRITGRELVSISRSAAGVRLATLGLVLGCGAAAAVLYLITHAAD